MIAAGVVIVATLGALAVAPVSTSDLDSRPRPPLGYDSSVAEIRQRQRREDTTAVATAHSILLTRDRATPIAVLLLHGFTNSPRQFDSLGHMLFREGYNVYVPLLPRHADRARGPRALSSLTAEELRAAADSAMDLTRALGDTVVVVGLSAGGTMAAWIAQHRADARRVIVIAPLMAIAGVPSWLDAVVANLSIRLPNVAYDLTDFDGEADRERGWSSHAVGEILRLGIAVERAADRQPPRSRTIAFVLNGNDRTISAAPVTALGRQWEANGASVQTYELPASLALPHDVIDPRQRVRRPDVVYPLLVDLVRGLHPGRDVLPAEARDLHLKS